MTKKTIERAYEELRAIIDGGSESFTHEDAVQYLKDKLAQPAVTESHKQEPVAWAMFYNGYFIDAIDPDEHARIEGDYKHALYTTPPQRTAAEGEDTRRAWVGLTEREQGAIMEDLNAHGTNLYPFAQAIEAKLKEKNTRNGGCL